MPLRRNVIGDATLLRAFSCLDPFPSAVLAVSGGPDSMALMTLASRWLHLAGRDPASIRVATVDHRLRPQSKEEADFVAAEARALGLSHATLVWAGEKPKTGIQAAARAARYDMLVTHARACGAASIVTAHTEDDQAETLMMRLRRGSGLDGLAAMAEVSHRDGVPLVRPLLGFSKARLTAYLRAASVPFRSDPSNENAAFERVRLRHIARALALAGVTRSSLATTAARLGRSRDALASLTDDFLSRNFEVGAFGQGSISRAALEAVPEDIALRALGRIVSLIGGRREKPLRLVKLEQFFSSLGSKNAKTTFGGCIMMQSPGAHHIFREPGRLRAKPMPFRSGETCVWDRRFILTFATLEDRSLIVSQLGAPGWLSYKKTMRERGLSPAGDRLAALSTPALWKGDRLICAPLLAFSDRTADTTPPLALQAALVPDLAAFQAGSQRPHRGCLAKPNPYPMFD